MRLTPHPHPISTNRCRTPGGGRCFQTAGARCPRNWCGWLLRAGRCRSRRGGAAAAERGWHSRRVRSMTWLRVYYGLCRKVSTARAGFYLLFRTLRPPAASARVRGPCLAICRGRLWAGSPQEIGVLTDTCAVCMSIRAHPPSCGRRMYTAMRNRCPSDTLPPVGRPSLPWWGGVATRNRCPVGHLAACMPVRAHLARALSGLPARCTRL